MKFGPSNTTLNDTAAFPTTHIFTGHGNAANTRAYYRLYGDTYINVLEPYFDGT